MAALFFTVPVPVRLAVGLWLAAEVVASPAGTHGLGPGVAGRLVRWHVASGQAVAAGAPLADLVSGELSGLAAEASRRGVMAGQTAAIQKLREAAAAGGVVSAADVADAALGAAEAEAALRTAERVLAAHRDTSTAEGGVWTWRAPVDGTVASVACPLGNVDAGRTCLTLVTGDDVQVRVAVRERHLPYI